MDIQEKKDRLTGLLALVAEEKTVSGCLTAEELALLVDADGEDRNGPLYAHLSSCEECYNTWLLARKAQSKSSRKSKMHLFPGKKSYKYIGTGLALAATVALYLNITDFKDVSQPPRMDKRVEQGIVAEKDADALIMPAEEEPRELADDKTLDAVPQTGAARKNALAPRKEESLFKTQSIPQKLKNTTDRAASVMEDEMALPASPEAAVVISADRFMQSIEKGCQMQQYDPDLWQRLARDGAQLQSRPGFGGMPEQNVITELATLLQDMDENSYRKRCTMMLHILAEEKKSR